jgi:hypothetical protein
VLLVAEPGTDPLLEPLSEAAFYAWLAAVGYCDRFHTDILQRREVEYATESVIDEWEHAALAERLPGGNLRFLARRRLWDFDRARVEYSSSRR